MILAFHAPTVRQDANSDSGPATGPVILDRKLVAALLAEFFGLVLFQLMGGDAPDSAAAYGNGISLMVLIFATANVSGGHLNPAVTLATILTGHMYWTRGVLYMIAQVCVCVGGCSIGIHRCCIMHQPTMTNPLLLLINLSVSHTHTYRHNTQVFGGIVGALVRV